MIPPAIVVCERPRKIVGVEGRVEGIGFAQPPERTARLGRCVEHRRRERERAIAERVRAPRLGECDRAASGPRIARPDHRAHVGRTIDDGRPHASANRGRPDTTDRRPPRRHPRGLGNRSRAARERAATASPSAFSRRADGDACERSRARSPNDARSRRRRGRRVARARRTFGGRQTERGFDPRPVHGAFPARDAEEQYRAPRCGGRDRDDERLRRVVVAPREHDARFSSEAFGVRRHGGDRRADRSLDGAIAELQPGADREHERAAPVDERDAEIDGIEATGKGGFASAQRPMS